MSGLFGGWGEYPSEYNREIHGPYNPSMYYGKRDTPFGEVKLREFGGWLARRNKSPRAIAQAISRAWFRYQYNWVQTKKPNIAFLYQMMFCTGLIFMMVDYDKYRKERSFRYH